MAFKRFSKTAAFGPHPPQGPDDLNKPSRRNAGVKSGNVHFWLTKILHTKDSKRIYCGDGMSDQDTAGPVGLLDGLRRQRSAL